MYEINFNLLELKAKKQHFLKMFYLLIFLKNPDSQYVRYCVANILVNPQYATIAFHRVKWKKLQIH